MTAPAALRDEVAALKRWLTLQAYPLWWTSGADLLGGGYHDRLDLNGRPVPGPKRARVQARQAFCYAAAPALGWDGPWREAMTHGLQMLVSRYRRPDGLYRSWHTDGQASDDHATLYDQAFVLLALSAAHSAGDGGAMAEAESLLGRLSPHPDGGFRELDGESLKANPNMHLFEAFMAWAQAGGGTVWQALADRQAELGLRILVDPETGAIAERTDEVFGDDWGAPEDRARRIVAPGHLFEWAWLLLRWNETAARRQGLAGGLRLIELGERSGVDSDREVAINALTQDLSPIDLSARLWPQTERIKAAALAAHLTGDAAYWAMAERGVRTLKRYLGVPTAGLWHDTLNADGEFIDEPAPASSFYHIVLAIQELDRVVAA